MNIIRYKIQNNVLMLSLLFCEKDLSMTLRNLTAANFKAIVYVFVKSANSSNR